METEEEKKKRQEEQARRFRESLQRNGKSFEKGFNSKPAVFDKLKSLFSGNKDKN